MSSVGAHCPTNKLACFCPMAPSVSDVAIEPTAAHRKVSEGSLAVCVSMAFATRPSVCCSYLRSIIDVVIRLLRMSVKFFGGAPLKQQAMCHGSLVAGSQHGHTRRA